MVINFKHAFQLITGKGHFIVSGSDIVQFMVLESASIVKDWFSYDNQLLSSNNTFYNVTTSRLALDIPHAVLSYMVNSKNNYKYLYNRQSSLLFFSIYF